MKSSNISILSIAAAFAICACAKPNTASLPEELPMPEPITSPTVITSSTPAIATPAPIKALAFKQPEVAPDGIFFLITSISVETSDSLIRLRAGKVLKLIGDDLYLVDGMQVKISKDKVTNSIAAERAILASEIARRSMPFTTTTETVAPIEQQAQTQPQFTQPSGPSVTSMGANSVHDKVRIRRDLKTGRMVTEHIQ